MGFSFFLTVDGTDMELDFGRSMHGLWDAFGLYRTNPTEAELYEKETDFNGWKVPWGHIYKMYAGALAIEMLKPDNHPLYPEWEDGYPGEFKEGYWRLLEHGDFMASDEGAHGPTREDEIGINGLQAKVDFQLAAKVQFIYNNFILNNLSASAAGDYDHHLSVYFWHQIEELRSWLQKVIELHENDSTIVVRFHGGY